jgi:hypothetical protein
MLGKHFGRTIHVPGALTADLDIRLSVPVDCRLKRVSAVASNDSDATLAIGISTDTDSILTAATIGDSQTPVTKDVSDWATTNPTGDLDQGDILVLTVDYDGASGTAAQDLTIDLDFIEG